MINQITSAYLDELMLLELELDCYVCLSSDFIYMALELEFWTTEQIIFWLVVDILE